MTNERRRFLALCEPEKTPPKKHTTTVNFDSVIKFSVEYDLDQIQVYLEKCFRALARERFPNDWTKVTLEVGLYDEYYDHESHDLFAGLYCNVEGATPISLDRHMELSAPLWNKSPSREKLAKDIAAKMESYIRSTIGDSVIYLIVREIRANDAACRTSNWRISKKEFNRLSSIPPIGLIPLPPKRGGRRNVKIADQPEDVLRALGSEYIELKPVFKKVKKDAKRYYNNNKNNWRSHLARDYPILNSYPDMLDKMEQVYFGGLSDHEASGTVLDPWEVAYEIAARRAIPDYKSFGATADTLRRHAILPEVN